MLIFIILIVSTEIKIGVFQKYMKMLHFWIFNWDYYFLQASNINIT